MQFKGKQHSSRNQQTHSPWWCHCQYSGPAQANQLSPTPGTSTAGVGQGWCGGVLFNNAYWSRKKYISYINKFILVYYLLSTSNTPQINGVIHSACSPLVAPALLYPLHLACVFLVGSCMLHHWLAASSCQMYFVLFNFFVAPFDAPNNGMTCPHTLPTLRASSPTSNLSHMPTLGWLLCLPIKRQPP